MILYFEITVISFFVMVLIVLFASTFIPKKNVPKWFTIYEYLVLTNMLLFVIVFVIRVSTIINND